MTGLLDKIDKRLIPVVALLIAAIVAIPFLLKPGSSPGDVAAAPAPAVVNTENGSDALAATPVVTQATAADLQGRRDVLGTPKDPFKPTGIKKKKAVATPTPTGASGKVTAAANAATGGASSNPGTGGTTSNFGGETTGNYPPQTGNSGTQTTTDPTDKDVTKVYAIDVRIKSDGTDDTVTKRDVPRLTALPDNKLPVLVYLGLLKAHDKAVFLVSSDVKVISDGHCQPSKVDCERIELGEGDVMFFSTVVKGVQYQYELRLLHIRQVNADQVAKAAQASTHELVKQAAAKGGAKAVAAALADQHKRNVRLAGLKRRDIKFGTWLVKLQKARLGGLAYDAKTHTVGYPKKHRAAAAG